MMKNKNNTKIFYFLAALILVVIFVLCVCLGSTGFAFEDKTILNLRISRVVCVAIIGASLSICGASMQGLLRNPLADGTTLGVSSGASVGAVISIIVMSALPFSMPIFGKSINVVLPMIFAFLSLLLIMGLAYKLDKRLSSNIIILIGIVFTMFASSCISLLVSLFPENAKTITFWTMGSVSGVDINDCCLLLVLFIVCYIVLYSKSVEINAFSLGEDNASHLGVNVKSTKIIVMIFVSVLIGACVSVSGTIGFVGLIVPHISRLIVGPNNNKVFPFSVLFGSSFLMLADLLSRTLIVPKELPIGVITSIIGAIVFVFIFFKQRKNKD